MLKRVYIDNYRAFVNFELSLGQTATHIGFERQRQVVAVV